MSVAKIYHHFIVSIFLFFNFSEYGESARILALFPFAGKSHFIMFQKTMMEMAKHGHEVDVYSHFPLEKPLKGYHDYSLVGTFPIITGSLTMDEVKSWRNLLTVLDVMTVMLGVNVCNSTLQSQPIRDLKNSAKKYDVLVTELFGNDCMLGFAHHLNIPSIIMESAPHYAWTSDYVGLPDNPSYIPNYHSSFSPRMTFYERLMNTVILWTSKIYYKYYSLEPCTALARDFFGPDLPHLETLLRNVSLVLVNSHFSINQARPLPPNVVQVGGIHIEEPKPLNSHLLKLIENLEPTQRGVIYFSLGSLVVTDTLPDEILQSMFRAFEKLPYRVLWKARREKISKNLTIPKNIHFEPWVPQFDILCHPNVELYISHGGNAGVEESIYCGVPMIGIPLFGDQELNIAQAVDLGMALKVEFTEITEKALYEAAYELLNDPKYQESVKRVQQNFKDRPLSAKDTARYWIEYVINHRGAPELRSASTELYLYQYYLLDVALVVVSVPALVFYFVFVIVRTICRRLSVVKIDKMRKNQ